MKITLVSDLHLEFSDVNIVNNGVDVLILGGDIMIAQDLHDHPEPVSAVERSIIANSQGLGRRQESAQRYRDFLKRVSFQFPHVIYIAGNHEFYHGKFPAGIDYLREETDKFDNIYFLENQTKVIDDVTFIGTTLWTDMNKGDPLTINACKDSMNDYRVIRNNLRSYAKFSPIDSVSSHRKSVRFIKKTVAADPNKKYVVVGHHAPSKMSTKPKYEKDYLLNGAYSSDLSELILDHPQIKLWTHGHTHDVFDYTIGSTRIVCNPRGYEGYEPDSGWDPNLVINV
jgi:Icc-related predicted phosphoesterase